MCDLKNICFICLNNNISLRAVVHNDVHNVNILTEVKYVVPELDNTTLDSENPLHICSLCCTTLHSFYTFKKMCLDNYSRLLQNTNIFQKSSNTQNQNFTELQSKIVNSEPMMNQEQDIDIELNIKEESGDSLLLLEDKGDQNTNVEDNVDMKEELIAPEDSLDRGCYQLFEFVKYESVSENIHDDGSFVTTEDSNPFDKDETDKSIHIDKQNYDISIHSKKLPKNSDLPKQTIDEYEDTELPCTPAEVRNIATNAANPLLPEKSKPKYEKEYQNFCEWCNGNNVINITENIVLEYFKFMSETKKASTMWATYSMLRTCLSIYKNTDISKYSKVTVFLKRISQNYKPKKSKILDSEDIIKFINDANNDTFLAMKVILIMGYCGACRRNELTNMNLDYVEIKFDVITVNVPKTKTNSSRLFVITEASWIALIKSYVQLRPAHTTHNRFFLTYRRGRCTTSPIGINKIGEVPKNIAKFLKLPNPELYTGHCFRRSSASHLANHGSDMLTIRKHGEWKCSSVAEEYIDSSIRKKVVLSCTPPEESNIATNTVNALLPEKSKPKYEKEYQNFCEWCNGINVINITENIVLTYFKFMSETKKASTMWATYSMLRTCLSIYKNTDISKYSKVTAFLKRISQNYKPKKSKILDSEDVIKFINDANNDTFLAMKVILIMGYCGACRRNELTNMYLNNVEIKIDVITVNVPKTKTNSSRLFVITEASWIALIKSYVQLRPAHTTHNRFFLTYRRGRCTTSPIGINKIGEVPKNIAKFLKLPNPELYTGHCFRRSSASHLANHGSDMLTIKKHGGWKSLSRRIL